MSKKIKDAVKNTVFRKNQVKAAETAQNRPVSVGELQNFANQVMMQNDIMYATMSVLRIILNDLNIVGYNDLEKTTSRYFSIQTKISLANKMFVDSPVVDPVIDELLKDNFTVRKAAVDADTGVALKSLSPGLEKLHKDDITESLLKHIFGLVRGEKNPYMKKEPTRIVAPTSKEKHVILAK